MAIQKPFVVKNGLTVSDNLIIADSSTNRVGIGTINPIYPLHVRGGIGATHSNITGISTVANLVINGTVSVGNSIGKSKQYLISTGVGVGWTTVSPNRSSVTFNAGIGQSIFAAPYDIGYVDVFINGVKLVPPPSPYAEYLASNGTEVQINDPCFGGEIVEITYIDPTDIGIGNSTTLLRSTVSTTLTGIATGITTEFTLNLGKVSNLISVNLSHPSWVRFYRSAAQRTSDVRTGPSTTIQELYLLGDSRPYAEILTTTTPETAFPIPVPILVGDGSSLVYLKLKNNSGITTNITITNVILKLEA